nr:heterokaryon incompatibility protein [Colletotrichum truncatum]KAF6781005.1 heterokaryon incompatibility protein [Colletotrichum truncatum]
MREGQEARVNWPIWPTLGSEQMRLLDLQPAVDISDSLCCTLRMASLTQSPFYEAVSYVWGHDSHRKTIKVDGTETVITNNLFDVLHSLRRKDSVRTLWIDALCINQADPEERYNQVKIMGRIYQQAFNVAIFLGSHWDGLDIARDYLELAAEREEAHFDPLLKPHLEVRGYNISMPHLRNNLSRFFSSDWFFRVWTVQEFVLARQTSFLYGTTVIDGGRFMKGFASIRRHISSRCCGPRSLLECGERFFDVMIHIESLINMRASLASTDLLQVLHDCRRRKCTNPLDRIYGMLGMDFKGQSSGILPDYSITTEELFVGLTKEQMDRTKTLDILTYVDMGRQTVLNLPSFVPDWTMESTNRLTHMLSVDQQLATTHYKASGEIPAKFEFRFKDNGHLMLTKGVIIGYIESVGTPGTFSDLESFSQAKDIVSEARELARLPSQPPISWQAATPQELAFWRTLCGNLTINYLEGDREWTVSDPELDYESYLRWNRAMNKLQEGQPAVVGDEPFQDALIPNLSGRRFTRTETGLIGMVAADSLPGDVIVVLPGGRIPYVLREKHGTSALENAKTYRFIGNAYIDGFMYGEAAEHDAEWASLFIV